MCYSKSQTNNDGYGSIFLHANEKRIYKNRLVYFLDTSNIFFLSEAAIVINQ